MWLLLLIPVGALVIYSILVGRMMLIACKLQYGRGAKYDDFRYRFYASRNLCDPRLCPHSRIAGHGRCQLSERSGEKA